MVLRFSIVLAALLPLAHAETPPSVEELAQKVMEERQKAKTAGLDSASVLNRAKRDSGVDWLRGVDESLTSYQNTYDDLVKTELDSMIRKAEEVLRAIEADPASGKKELAAVKSLFAQAEKFRELRPLYGTGPDVKRKSAYQNFFADFKKLNDHLEKRPIAERLRAQLQKVVELFRVFLAIRGEVPDFLAKLYFPGKASKPQMVGKLNDGFKAYAKGMGYEVEVNGRENIPALTHGRTINIYAPTHRQGIHDGMLMAEIMPRDSLLFMAPRNFLGAALGGQFDGVDGFVAVGSKKKSMLAVKERAVDVAIQQLKKHQTQNIFIYPEGGLPTGILENQPVREKFGSELIKELRAAGYEVNLIPITYQNSARFMNKGNSELEGKKLMAEIHPAVPDSVLGRWEKYDPTFVNRYLRSVHMEGMETNERQLVGLLRPEKLNPALERFLGGCHGYFASLKK